MHDTHQSVHSSVRLILDATTFGLAVIHGGIDKASVPRLSSSGQDQRRVGGGILKYRLVSIDNISILCTNVTWGL